VASRRHFYAEAETYVRATTTRSPPFLWDGRNVAGSCINWLRTLPYVRAWAARYKEQGVVVIGVDPPAFSFEEHVDNVRKAAQERGVTYPVADSERLQAMNLKPGEHVLSVEKGRNFELLAQLLGRGAEMPRTTHADGVETSSTLYFHPEVVRPGYQQLPAPPLSILDNNGVETGRSTNPSGSGGFPFDKASAAVGKQIVDYKTARIGDTYCGC
jgi:hypothetical protein